MKQAVKTSKNEEQSPIFTIFITDRRLTSDLDRMGYKEMGMKVFEASTLSDVKKWLKTQPINLIIINCFSEEKEKIQMLREIKKMTDTPIIATGITDSPSWASQCQNAGASLYVIQPIPRQYYFEKIKNILKESIREQKRAQVKGLFVGKIHFQEKKSACLFLNISQSGALLSVPLSLEINDEIHLDFKIPNTPDTIKITAQIMRVTKTETESLFKNKKTLSDNLIAVSFGKINHKHQLIIEEYVQENRDDLKELQYYI